VGAPGCDDAPVITVPLTGERRTVTLVYPYYENPEFLALQLRHLDWMPVDLREHLELIVVDDGSPEHPAAEVMRAVSCELKSVRLFRLGVDVRWNWLAARNIGAHHARTDWISLTDMDHRYPVDAIETLVLGEHSRGVIYRFSRREHDGRKIHPHPNSWFMTRENYWRVGGYDEALSGHYGTDGEYRRRCAAAAPIRIMTTELERHEYVGDSSTTRYLRKQPEDAVVKHMIRARKPGWKPCTLSFPYAEVSL
jgi:glycosyltransferase involved in cell wall biosynthesis